MGTISNVLFEPNTVLQRLTTSLFLWFISLDRLCLIVFPQIVSLYHEVSIQKPFHPAFKVIVYNMVAQMLPIVNVVFAQLHFLLFLKFWWHSFTVN